MRRLIIWSSGCAAFATLSGISAALSPDHSPMRILWTFTVSGTLIGWYLITCAGGIHRWWWK